MLKDLITKEIKELKLPSSNFTVWNGGKIYTLFSDPAHLGLKGAVFNLPKLGQLVEVIWQNEYLDRAAIYNHYNSSEIQALLSLLLKKANSIIEQHYSDGILSDFGFTLPGNDSIHLTPLESDDGYEVRLYFSIYKIKDLQE